MTWISLQNQTRRVHEVQLLEFLVPVLLHYLSDSLVHLRSQLESHGTLLSTFFQAIALKHGWDDIVQVLARF